MNNEIKGICCEVQNCKYHEKTNKCSAGHIKVGCDKSSAMNNDDTVCQTFEACDDCGINPCHDDCDCGSQNCNR